MFRNIEHYDSLSEFKFDFPHGYKEAPQPECLIYQLEYVHCGRGGSVAEFWDPLDWEPPRLLWGGFSRQEYWRGLPFPSPKKLPNPGIKSGFPTKQEDSLPAKPPGKFSAYFHRGILKTVLLLPVIQNGRSSNLSQWHLPQRDFFSYFNGLSPTHLFQSPNLDEMEIQFANILIKPLKAIWRAYILLLLFFFQTM